MSGGAASALDCKDQFYGVEAMSDVVLQVRADISNRESELISFHLHKQQLANTSKYFATMFLQDPTVQEVVLSDLGCPCDAVGMRLFLPWLYNPLRARSTPLTTQQTIVVLRLAHYFDAAEPLALIGTTLESMVTAIEPDQLMNILVLAETVSMSKLRALTLEQAWKHIQSHKLVPTAAQFGALGVGTQYELFVKAVNVVMSPVPEGTPKIGARVRVSDCQRATKRECVMPPHT
jgi:hypothetical protein